MRVIILYIGPIERDGRQYKIWPGFERLLEMSFFDSRRCLKERDQELFLSLTWHTYFIYFVCLVCAHFLNVSTPIKLRQTVCTVYSVTIFNLIFIVRLYIRGCFKSPKMELTALKIQLNFAFFKRLIKS